MDAEEFQFSTFRDRIVTKKKGGAEAPPSELNCFLF